VVAAGSAHAAIAKACDILRVRLVEVPIDPLTCEMDVGATAAAITPNTIMLCVVDPFLRHFPARGGGRDTGGLLRLCVGGRRYASAPNYPQGIIDPIEALSTLALKHGVGTSLSAHGPGDGPEGRALRRARLLPLPLIPCAPQGCT
jgi:sphinganine-1-phosphate aldolase